MKPSRLHFGTRMVHSGQQAFEGTVYDVWSMVVLLKEHGERDLKKCVAVTTKRMFPKDSPKELVAEILIKEAMSNPAFWGKLLSLQNVCVEAERSVLTPDELGDTVRQFVNG